MEAKKPSTKPFNMEGETAIEVHRKMQYFDAKTNVFFSMPFFAFCQRLTTELPPSHHLTPPPPLDEHRRFRTWQDHPISVPARIDRDPSRAGRRRVDAQP